ncbi:hypothetical protein N474_02705 [Pseudoalteromonas luteoviolacea CPMOR-2]|uniref:non-ribosomal peptide synthetase n=1 Tax=Pseudoalteromonas luteoviolacea TaxID=43657 RepID=UPI0007B0467E|nr:non-ribosomal peptide synthetase [Pseudoalteromonas luteoviolacea]KZN52842.1 hypothetical protein N474_02705 [Pseudoalteromonas luteoviolacea CPMOR-2]
MALEVLKAAKEKGIQIFIDGGKLKVKSPPGAMTDELRASIKGAKPELMALLTELASVKEANNQITIKRQGLLQAALSYPQQRLWVTEQLSPESGQFVMPAGIRLEGKLNKQALQSAFNEIVRRHEILRTVYIESDGQARQVVKEASPLKIKELDLSRYSQEAQARELDNLMKQEVSSNFNLEHDLMIRVTVVKQHEENHVVFFTLHHIATDGWSMGILVNEFTQLYTAFDQQKAPELLPLPIQYADYAAWQREFLQGPNVQKQLEFWRNELDGIPSLHNVQLDKVRPAIQTSAGQTFNQHLSIQTIKQLKAFQQRQNVSMFALLETVFAVLIGRYSCENDVVIGTPVSGREISEVQPLIGFFVNNLALRCQIDPKQNFSALLSENNGRILTAFENQALPFESLVDELGVERDLSHSPIFQIVFSYSNAEGGELKLPGLKVSALAQESAAAKVDLEVVATEVDGEFRIGWTYNVDLFDEQTIEALALSYEELLTQIIQYPEKAVGELATIDESKKHNLVALGKGVDSNIEDLCVHEAISQAARLAPDAIAISDDSHALTYAELEIRAQRLSAYLDEMGIGVGAKVGICLERTPALMIALLGVMKSGAAYVALESTLPLDRLEYIVADADIEIVIYDAPSIEKSSISGVDVFMMEDAVEDEQWLSEFDDIVVETAVCKEDPVYVLYTSGSTGKPKGVVVPHCGVMNYLNHATHSYINEQISGSVVSSPLCFDATVTTLYSPLMVGKQVHFIPEHAQTLDMLAEKLFDSCSGLLFKITPAHIEALTHIKADVANCPSPHVIVIGGEQLTFKTLAPMRNELLPCATFVNEYGPTETVVGCSTYTLAPNSDTVNESQDTLNVPIGKPIRNTQLYVLSESCQMQPQNSLGELYIGGNGVTLGYINREELTAERFIDNPFGVEGKLYKTGDLVRWRSEGELEFIGRVDDQVKIRGYRIELGEIESILASLDCIQEVVVIAHSDGQSQRLVTYLVPASSHKAQAGDSYLSLEAELKSTLTELLPVYMIPSLFIFLDSLPLTANGKVDKKRLPEPSGESVSKNEYVAPRNELELTLSLTVQEVLNVEKVGIEDNFFSIGGDSILAIRIVSSLKKQGIALTIQDLFKYQTVRELSAFVREHGCKDEELEQIKPFELLNQHEKQLLETEFVDAYPLSELQSGMVFHSQLDGFKGVYHDINGEHIKYQWDQEKFSKALEACIQHHPILRTTYRFDGDRPLQCVRANIDLPLEVEDISHLSSDEQDVYLTEWTSKRRTYVFDWENGPLFKVFIFLRDSESFQYIVSFHHSILDGWSRATLNTELYRYYSTLLSGNNIEPTEVDWTYRQFIAAELDVLDNEDAKAFFNERLEGVPQRQLPISESQSEEKNNGHAHFIVEGIEEYSKPIIELASNLGVPVQAVLLAVHYRVLSLYSGQNQVMSCFTVNGRPENEGAEQGVGLFLNSLPVGQVLSDLSWRDYIKEVAENITQSMLYRRYPLSKIQQEVDKEFSEITFNYTHFHVLKELLADDNKELEVVGSTGSEHTNFDFTVDVSRSVDTDSLAILFSYNASLYSPSHVSEIAQYYVETLKVLLSDINVGCLQQQILLNNQVSTLEGWNDTLAENQHGNSLLERFNSQVQSSPSAIALQVIQGSTAIELTYQELNERANQLAHYLLALGVKPNSLLGVCLDRSADLMVAVLGIMKTGAAYVPLEPSLPEGRLEYIVEDTDLNYIITHSNFMLGSKSRTGKIKFIELDNDNQQALLVKQPIANPDIAIDFEHLAYVIYTSGSTGNPKGVKVPHKGLANYLEHTSEQYDGDSIQGGVVSSPLCFDATVTTLFTPLVVGKTVKLLPESNEILALLKAELIQSQGDWIFKLTPSHLDGISLLMEGSESSENRHKLVVGGEQLNYQTSNLWLSKYLPNSAIINEYGPTETVVGCSTHTLTGEVNTQELSGPVPIGCPIRNTKLYVLSSEMHLQPLLSVGELYIGGEGVTQGYLNRDELTSEKFVQNPLNPAEKLYRTGDLVRRLQNGELEFVGRMDDQIKIRGFRIELGEVEAQLCQVDDVKSSFVTAMKDSRGGTCLVAYLVASEQSQTDSSFIARVRAQISQHLPEYMIPNSFILMNEFPYTVNGKLDIKGLPAPQEAMSATNRIVNKATTDVQIKLAKIWSEVLNLPSDQIDIENSFFEQGGHSIDFVRLQVKINKALSISLSLADLYSHSNIKLQAEYLENLQNAHSAAESSNEIVCLKQGSADLAPLVLIHPVGGTISKYFGLANLVKYEGSIFAVQMIDDSYLSIEKRATRYNSSIGQLNLGNRYHLAGWSLGGTIAFEMAKQLASEGGEVESLTLIDSANPTFFKPRQGNELSEELYTLYELALELGIHVPEHVQVQVEGKEIDEAIAMLLALGVEQNVLPIEASVSTLKQYFNRVKSNKRSIEVYQPSAYLGQANLIKALENPTEEITTGWELLVGKLNTLEVKGNHYSIFDNNNLITLAESLNKVMGSK